MGDFNYQLEYKLSICVKLKVNPVYLNKTPLILPVQRKDSFAAIRKLSSKKTQKLLCIMMVTTLLTFLPPIHLITIIRKSSLTAEPSKKPSTLICRCTFKWKIHVLETINCLCLQNNLFKNQSLGPKNLRNHAKRASK